MTVKPIVVRFAPSPTGYLHIGGARTAIFNWLYARKKNGKFILRIEDTDAERSTKDSIQGIVDGLEWLGLEWDDGPFFQSRFVEEHRRAAMKMVASGHAYQCFCSKEALDARREAARASKRTYRYEGNCRNLSAAEIAAKEAAGEPYTVRMKIPDENGSVSFTDAVYGTVEKKFADLEDFVLLRSNGQPLYVLSNAVDDIRDGVTHVIRGQDGLANTPKQILIYRALGAPVPVFAHMSLTLDPQKRKISKRRHGQQVAIHFYREKGFLPWAMVNFLVLLGWAAADNREIFTQQELIEAFDLSGISRTNSVFNVSGGEGRFFTDPKAVNINAHYLRTMPVASIADFVAEHLQAAGLWQEAYADSRRDWFLSTVDLLRERFTVLTDFADSGRAFFSDDYPIDATLAENQITKYPELAKWLPHLASELAALDAFNEKSIERVFRETAANSGIKIGILVNAVRAAVTGQAKGADFLRALIAIGKQSTSKRIEQAALLFG